MQVIDMSKLTIKKAIESDSWTNWAITMLLSNVSKCRLKHDWRSFEI